MSDSDPRPKVVLLGRPNVGKSTLFNRLIRSNRAITHDRPGITRDRMLGIVRSRELEDFFLEDTGGVTIDGHAGIEPGPEGIRGFEAAILAQVKQAVAVADLLCLVVDARDGLTPYDRHLAAFLRCQGKPLLLAVNKVDGPEKADILLAEFHELGLDMLPCSAAHGFNVQGLEEEMRERLFPMHSAKCEKAAAAHAAMFAREPRCRKIRVKQAASTEQEQAAAQDSLPVDGQTWSHTAGGDCCMPAEENDVYEQDVCMPCLQDASDVPDALVAELSDQSEEFLAPLRLCMLGRPNSGKSSLVNALLGEPRMIVSDMAGTTRDSVDVAANINGFFCIFVDTAGVRRRSKIVDVVERYSVNSSLKSTTKAHVTLLVLDVLEGLTVQDKRLLALLHERKTPFMLLVNKCDLVDQKDRKKMSGLFNEALVFCPHVPVLFVSARNGHNLQKIVPLARDIQRECELRVSTGRLNRVMHDILAKHSPPVVGQKRAKFFYMTQAESRPPTFVFFVNNADNILPSYARYLERSLRELFGIRHAPLRVHFRSSHSGNIQK